MSVRADRYLKYISLYFKAYFLSHGTHVRRLKVTLIGTRQNVQQTGVDLIQNSALNSRSDSREERNVTSLIGSCKVTAEPPWFSVGSTVLCRMKVLISKGLRITVSPSKSFFVVFRSVVGRKCCARVWILSGLFLFGRVSSTTRGGILSSYYCRAASESKQ